MRPQLRTPWAISAAIAVLMSVQALAGLFVDGVYRDDAWVQMTWFGNDLVTLLVAVPLLVAGLALARRGSRRGELVWYGMLGYAVYNYGFYLFGAQLNVLFPLIALLVVLSVLALITALGRIDAEKVAADYAASTPVRWVAGYMVATGAVLLVAWIAQWAAYIFGGVEPAIGTDAFALIAAMDLTFVVPFMLLGGVMLWRRRPWGYVLGPIVTLKAATYTLVLTVNSYVGEARGFEGSAEQIPIWAAWTLVGVLAVLAMLRGVSPAARNA